MKRFFLTLVSIFLFASLAFGLPGTTKKRLVWDANSEEDLAGYYVYHRLESETYADTKRIDVGNNVLYNVTEEGIIPMNSYIALTAYDTSDNESEFSGEVHYDFFDQDAPALPGAPKWETYR